MGKIHKKVGKLLIAALMLGILLITSVSISQAAKEVKLIVWSGYPELNPFYELAAKDYEREHTNVKIEVAAFALRDYERKLAMALPSGTCADIFMLGSEFFPRYIGTGYLLPNPSRVDAFLKGNRYNQLFVSWQTLKGKTYGLPLFAGGPCLFWNKTMFAEAGLSSAPETYDELMEYARKLAKYDEKGNLIRSGITLRLSGGGSGVAQKWTYKLWAAGGRQVVRTPSGKYHNGYNNEAGRDALKWYIDALYKYHVDDFKIKHDAEAFALQKAAMLQRESWVIGYLKEHAPEVNYGVDYMPKWRRWGAFRNWKSMCIPSSCKNPDVAWDFLMYMQQPKYLKYMLGEIGWLPCRTDIDYEDIFKVIPQFRPFLVLPKGYLIYTDQPLPCQDEYQTKLAERLMAAFARKDLLDNPEGIAKVISEAAKETDEILKEAGLYGVE